MLLFFLNAPASSKCSRFFFYIIQQNQYQHDGSPESKVTTSVLAVISSRASGLQSIQWLSNNK